MHNFIKCGEANFKIEFHHDHTFFFFYLLLAYLLMGNFVKNSFYSNWVDFFIFACNEHASDTSLMDVLNFNSLLYIMVIVIHKVNSIEECLVVTMITAHYFNHPINHFGPETWSYLLILQWKLILTLFLKIKELRLVQLNDSKFVGNIKSSNQKIWFRLKV